MFNALMVFIGGGLGSCLRYGISLWVPARTNGFPINTFFANMISCLIIGFLIGMVTKSHLSASHRLLLVTGFCGGFSTFSTFSGEIFDLLRAGYLAVALAYVVLSVLLGVVLVFVGLYLSGSVR